MVFKFINFLNILISIFVLLIICQYKDTCWSGDVVIEKLKKNVLDKTLI